MIIAWVETAWEDRLNLQRTDKKVIKRIKTLIKETMREPHTSIGNPEPLKHNWSGYWSRRIYKGIDWNIK